MTKEEFAKMMGVVLHKELPTRCVQATSIFDFMIVDPTEGICEPNFGMRFYIKSKFGVEEYTLTPGMTYNELKRYDILIPN